MRIALFSHTFLPSIGGREMVMYQLARALMRRGHDVSIIGATGFLAARDMNHGLDVRRYPRFTTGRPLKSIAQQLALETQLFPQLAMEVLTRGVDVVHAHTTYPAGYVAALVKRLVRDVCLVITPHGVDINTSPEDGYGMRLDARLRKKIDKAIAAADAVTAISDGVLQSLTYAGARPEKLHRIPNGVDIDRFSRASGVHVRSALEIPETAKLILTVGNYTPLKGHEDIIRSMPAILREEPNAFLVIVGRGTEHLGDFAAEHGVENRVKLTGMIAVPAPGAPDDLLASIYDAASVYVSASTAEGGEGLSLALLDALAAQLPLVATDITGNRDVVVPGKNGYLVPPGNSQSLASGILAVISNDSSRESMKCASAALAANYSWDRVAALYEELYGALLLRKS